MVYVGSSTCLKEGKAVEDVTMVMPILCYFNFIHVLLAMLRLQTK
jgi:hypothetical protein